MTYLFSKSFIEVSRVGDTWLSELKHYFIGIAACAFIALGSAYYLGTHREDGDPVLGGGKVVVDYEPTDDQRTRYGVVLFLCLSVPAMFGIHEALQELRYKRRQAYYPQQ